MNIPEVLEKYERSDAHYCVGWSRGREKFKGKPDMAKGSFYANHMWDDPAQGDEAVREKPLSWREWLETIETSVFFQAFTCYFFHVLEHIIHRDIYI